MLTPDIDGQNLLLRYTPVDLQIDTVRTQIDIDKDTDIDLWVSVGAFL